MIINSLFPFWHCTCTIWKIIVHPSLQVFLDFSSPKDWSKGKAFEQTLLGSLFTQSCIPKMELGPYEFFENPSTRTKQDIEATESSIQQVF